METIKERLLPETALGEGGVYSEKAVVFPKKPISRFRDEQDELNYYLCSHIKDERSVFFERILSDSV
nr:hypothetical protein [uncultured Schaedlerella sp.]